MKIPIVPGLDKKDIEVVKEIMKQTQTDSEFVFDIEEKPILDVIAFEKKHEEDIVLEDY